MTSRTEISCPLRSNFRGPSSRSASASHARASFCTIAFFGSCAHAAGIAATSAATATLRSSVRRRKSTLAVMTSKT
jgi:hypothetical protein